MPAKYCKWGLCKSDSNKDKTITFFPFPKPCKDFRLLKKDPSLVAIQHNPDSCSQCSKCKAWIHACSTQNFTSLDQINANCYVCYKHFVDNKPTETHPCPTSARSFSQQVGANIFTELIVYTQLAKFQFIYFICKSYM